MEIDKDRQDEALARAKRTIEEAEKERKKKRVSRGLIEIEKGNLGILRSDEMVKDLHHHLIDLFSTDRAPEGLKILASLGEGAVSAEVQLRERAVMVLSLFADHLLKADNKAFLHQLSGILASWLEQETIYITGFGVVCRQIGEIGTWLLLNECWQEAEHLLLTLHQIQTGIREKNNSIRGMAAKTQEHIASKRILQSLVEAYLADDEAERESVEHILVYLGKRSVIFLLNWVMHSESREERLLLIRLIPHVGNAAVPVLVECLQKKPPWFVVRNIVCIISEINDPSLYQIVKPYLTHKDIRVQNEVINCIKKLDGLKMKSRFLAALGQVSEELKAVVVRELAETADDDAAEEICELLGSRADFSERNRVELLSTLIIALKMFPLEKSIILLKELLGELTGVDEDAKLRLLVEDSLNYIQPQFRHTSRRQNTEEDELSYDDDPAAKHVTVAKIRDFEKEINDLVKVGDLALAAQKIFHRCISAAEEKDFTTAEMLRDRLLEINPHTLPDVIRAGEMIEEQKGSSITGQHLKIWGELYDTMTTDEFNALYYSMQLEQYEEGEIVVQAGETDTNLYFINAGIVSITCKTGSGEIFLKRMQPGDILGAEQFFSPSIWTITIRAQTAIQLHVLDRIALADIQEQFPEIEPKLRDYCRKYHIIPDLLKMSGEDRRDHPRYSVSLVITNMVFDLYGNTVKHLSKGVMLDISTGGFCFSVRIANQENANSLLGRHIKSEIDLGEGESFTCEGVIVGVRFLHAEAKDFIVHVRLFMKIEQAKVKRIVDMRKK